MDWEQLVGQFGVSGIIIGGLVWDRLRLLKENTDLQKEVRQLYTNNVDTLKEVTSALKGFAHKNKED